MYFASDFVADITSSRVIVRYRRMGKEIELFLSFAELFEYLEIVTIYA